MLEFSFWVHFHFQFQVLDFISSWSCIVFDGDFAFVTSFRLLLQKWVHQVWKFASKTSLEECLRIRSRHFSELSALIIIKRIKIEIWPMAALHISENFNPTEVAWRCSQTHLSSINLLFKVLLVFRLFLLRFYLFSRA